MRRRSGEEAAPVVDRKEAAEAEEAQAQVVIAQIQELLGIDRTDAAALHKQQLCFADCATLDESTLAEIGVDRVGPRRRIRALGSNVTLELALEQFEGRVVVGPSCTPDELEVLIRGSFPELPIDEIYGLRRSLDGKLYPLSLVCSNCVIFSAVHAPMGKWETRPDNWDTRGCRCQVVCSLKQSAVRNWGIRLGGALLVLVLAQCIGLLGVVGQFVGLMIGKVHDTFVRHPLQRMYWGGPTIRLLGTDIGFWGGLPRAMICQQLTQTSADLWLKNMTECIAMYEAKQDAFVFLAELAGVLFCLYFSKTIVQLIAIVTGHRTYHDPLILQ